MASDLENYIVAVERIQEYVNCPKEVSYLSQHSDYAFIYLTYVHNAQSQLSGAQSLSSVLDTYVTGSREVVFKHKL